MAIIMENLINNKYYKTKEEAIHKLNVFFAYNVITEEDFNRLMDLTESKYTVTSAS